MTKADQPDSYALAAENEWLEQEIAQMERKINEMALQANSEAERTIEQLHASDAAKKTYEAEKATTIALLTSALKTMEDQNTLIEGISALLSSKVRGSRTSLLTLRRIMLPVGSSYWMRLNKRNRMQKSIPMLRAIWRKNSGG